MHILYLCEEYPPPVIGGIGQVVRLLAEGLVARGHQATVIGQYWVGERQEYEQHGVTVIKLPRPKKNKVTRNDLVRRWLLAHDVRRLVQERDVDIVESPNYMGDGAFLKPFIAQRAHHVLRTHGADSVRAALLGYSPRRFSKFLESRALQQCGALVLVGLGAGLDYLRILKQPGRSYAVITNPVDTETFRPSAQSEDVSTSTLRLLYIGRVDPKKGAISLSNALPSVFEILPDINVRFAGVESYYDRSGRPGREIIADIVGSEHAKQLCFLGRLEHSKLVKEINDATVCILPSHIEDFPCAVIEAMACGKAVIASSRAYGGEVLVHNHSGMLVDPLDKEQMARTIIELMNNPEKRTYLGRNARTLIEARNSLDVVLAANIRYYESVLKGCPLEGELLPLDSLKDTSQYV
jgi:glycosyltransferase involved in cell wall biosynthesis